MADRASFTPPDAKRFARYFGKPLCYSDLARGRLKRVSNISQFKGRLPSVKIGKVPCQFLDDLCKANKATESPPVDRAKNHELKLTVVQFILGTK